MFSKKLQNVCKKTVGNGKIEFVIVIYYVDIALEVMYVDNFQNLPKLSI